MHSNCILGSATNVLVSHVIFVGTVQKSPVTSHLKDLDPSFKLCCYSPVLTRIKEDG